MCCLPRLYTWEVTTEPGQETKGFLEISRGELLLPVGDLLQTIRRRIWAFVLAIIVCTSALVGYSLQQTPVYQASIKILVGQNQGILEDPSQAVNLQQVALTLSEVVATEPVARPVVEKLNLRMSPEVLIANTSAQVISGTQIIEVSYADTNPLRAQRIVNAIGDQFSTQVSEVSPRANAISAIVWEQAKVPQAPISPNPLRNGLIGLVLGGMLGVALAFVLEHLDGTWRSTEEAAQLTGVPTLVVIPEFEHTKS